ncbi:hypothetical protein D9M68_969030 [compost metagenome]
MYPSDAVVDTEYISIRLLLYYKFIYSYDHLFAILNFFLVLISTACNFILDEPLFNGAYGTSHRIDLFYELPCFCFHFFGKAFHIKRTSQRVNRICDAAFITYDLLCT